MYELAYRLYSLQRGSRVWALKVKMDLRPRQEVDNDDDDGDDDDDDNYRCLGNRIRHMAALKYTKFSISIIEIPCYRKVTVAVSMVFIAWKKELLK